MTKEQIENRIKELENLQMENLSNITSHKISVKEIFAKDKEISKELNLLREKLTEVSLFPHGRDASAYGKEILKGSFLSQFLK